MSLTLQVHGARELRRLARQCRELGRRDLVQRLYRGFSRAVRPFDNEVREELPVHTPGTYTGELDSSLHIRASTRTVGNGVGVSIVGTALGRAKERDLPAVDRGVLRHPLFGDRRFWFTTSVVPGFFTGPPAERTIRRVEQAVEKVIDEVADELERG